MTRYGMVMDLNWCVGWYSCAAACKSEHATTQGIWWNKVMAQEIGEYPSAQLTYLPMACMQCDNAPCLKVCPTGATYKNSDGLIEIDSSKCIGCRYCMAACPYAARSFYQSGGTYYPGQPTTNFETAEAAQHVDGTVEKCNFCTELVDGGGAPACVEACPAYARVFGDLDDPSSEISQLISTRSGIQLLDDLGTQPKVYYLMPKEGGAPT